MHFTPRRRASRPRSRSHTGLALAEVPSTFAELLAFDHLMDVETRPGDAARADRPSGSRASFATVFRQTVLVRYEQRAYAHARRGQAR